MNDQQKKFCQNYIKTINCTQSAIAAGYSKKTAGSQGHRLLKNVEIQKYIQNLMDKRAEKTGITAERVVEEIATYAFNERDDEKLEPSIKLKALDMLGRHTNIYQKEKETESEAKTITIKLATDK